jgi:TldD protein
VNVQHEWKYFASSEGSYIEQEVMSTQPQLTVAARAGDVVRSRTLEGPIGTGGWELVDDAQLLQNAERIAAEAVEYAAAPAITPGVRDLILSPSHLSLTLHEIVSHPTELDRIMGYEANYAGTSFIKLGDIGKLKYGSKLFNITADKTKLHGNATYGYDDDGVKTSEFPVVRDGILVGVHTNREVAHYINEKTSRGCTQATTWRDYPFLRMANLHMDADPKGPSYDELIADTKDGVLIEGTGSFSIDQQRYNGQFGGNAFWEIKNGKKTRMVTNVTYNAITTDFWNSLDAVGNPTTWKMFGLTGDAKGQPTQSQRVSHGAPYCRVKKIMVGGAFQ